MLVFLLLHHLIDYVEGLIRKYDIGVAFTPNTPYPGTYQHEHHEEIGLYFDVHDWDDFDALSPMVWTDAFSVDDLRAIMIEASERLLRP